MTLLSTKLFNVAKVLKPQGVNGEIKVLPLLDNQKDLLKIKNIFIGANSLEPVAVISARAFNEHVLLKLDGVLSRDQAESLRGKELYAKREEMPKLSEDRFYIKDLIGCDIFDEFGQIGSLSNILQYGSADVYVVKGKTSFMFPALKTVIKETNIKSKKIVVDSTELKKVAVYDN